MTQETGSKSVTTSAGWDGLWDLKMTEYLNTTPRTGIFLAHYLPKARTFLELGAGSARDTFYLLSQNKMAVASDFSEEAVKAWKVAYGDDFPSKIVDAFNIDAADQTFDVTFHNGLYVLFEDPEILQLIVEQRRVTSQWMVFLAHNKRNHALEREFSRRAEADSLYRIRFFESDEMVRLVEKCGIARNDIFVRKFGGPADKIYHWMRATARDTELCAKVGRIVSPLYQLQPWGKVERVAIFVRCGR